MITIKADNLDFKKLEVQRKRAFSKLSSKIRCCISLNQKPHRKAFMYMYMYFMGFLSREYYLKWEQPSSPYLPVIFVQGSSSHKIIQNKISRQTIPRNDNYKNVEWGCPNGTKYPTRQPIPNRAI